MVTKVKPLGVIIISILMFFIGSLSLIGGIYIYLAKDIIVKVMLENYSDVLNEAFGVKVNESIVKSSLNFVSTFSLIFGVLYLSAGFGLWMLKEWGRILAIVLCGINVVYFVFVSFVNVKAVIYAIVNLIVIWYLMKRGDVFKEKSIEERILDQNP